MHWLLALARAVEFVRNSELDMIRIQEEMYAKREKETSDDRQQGQ